MRNRGLYQLAGSILLIFFIVLCYLVHFQPSYLTQFDQVGTQLLRAYYPSLNTFFIWFTKLADPFIIVGLTLGTALLLYAKKYFSEMIWLLLNTVVIAGLLNPVIKLIIMRDRPNLVHLVSEHSYSFPSGHSAGSMLFYGTLLFLLPVFLKKTGMRNFLQFILGGIICLIGISRIYLGVHYPSDILGGFCLGLSWLFLTYPIYRSKRHSNQTETN